MRDSSTHVLAGAIHGHLCLVLPSIMRPHPHRSLPAKLSRTPSRLTEFRLIKTVPLQMRGWLESIARLMLRSLLQLRVHLLRLQGNLLTGLNLRNRRGT